MSMLDLLKLGDELKNALDWIVPSALIIISIFAAALGIKTYKRVIQDTKMITGSIGGVLFWIFLVMILLGSWFYIRFILRF